MGELELRVAALETAFYEVGAFLDPLALDDAARSIKASLDGADGDERAIRLGALELIDNARNRYRGPVVGVAIKP